MPKPVTYIFRTFLTAAVLAACATPQTPAESTETAAESASGVASAEATPDSEQAVRDFYEGETVTLTVGFAAGGGFGVYATAVANHIGKHIPGNPTVIVEYQEGAGSLLALNDLYASAPGDGTEILAFHGGLILEEVLGQPESAFESTELDWVGVGYQETPACAASSASGFTSIEQAMADGENREIIVAGTGLSFVQKLLDLALDLNMQLVEGYEGTAAVKLAVLNGEVDAACTAWQSFRSTWEAELASGEVVLIVQGSPVDDYPGLEGVPWALDLAPDDDARTILERALTQSALITRGYALPPGVPAERVDALQQAFMDTMEDPDFLAEAEALKLDVDPLSGDDAKAVVASIASMPEDLKELLQPLIVSD